MEDGSICKSINHEMSGEKIKGENDYLYSY